MVDCGKVCWEEFDAPSLRKNPLKDPSKRTLPVWVPPGYESAKRKGKLRHYPVIYVLAGYGSAGEMMLQRKSWSETIADRASRLVRSQKMPPAILVLPDAFTRYGGSQYINSSAVGNYGDYLTKDIVQFVDANFRTIPNAGGRALVGRSSGGYAALVQGMVRPDLFGAVASHVGDIGFEYCYLPDVPKMISKFFECGGSKQKYFRAFEKHPSKPWRGWMETLNVFAMSACYAPKKGASLGFELPFDEKTGEFSDRVWNRWLQWDPLRMAKKNVKNLKKLRLVFFDSGSEDEFHMHLGARLLHRELKRLKIKHKFEEHPGGHGGTSYRFDRSFPLLLKAMDKG